MPALVVCDTSPIRALAQLDLLEILPRLFERVLIPPAVEAELAVVVVGTPLLTSARLPFVSVRAPRDAALVTRLRMTLDPGESEAIALAVEVRPDVLLVDDA